MLRLWRRSARTRYGRILHTFEAARRAWYIRLHIGPVDISIRTIWFLWIRALVSVLEALLIGSRLLKDGPGAYQVILEEVYGFGRRRPRRAGRGGREEVVPLYALVVRLHPYAQPNQAGMPNTYPSTANIWFPLVLAFLTFILTQYEGFRRNGAGLVPTSFRPGVAAQADHRFPSCGASRSLASSPSRSRSGCGSTPTIAGHDNCTCSSA